jgi:DNA-binding transcriptional LysR family regulator
MKIQKRDDRPINVEQVLKKVNLQDLELFEAVGRLGSVNSAARERNLQPPFVSKGIKKLEEKLKLVLFVRSTKGLSLTIEGAELMAVYVKLLQALSAIPWTPGSVTEESSKKLITAAATSFLVSHVVTKILPRLPSYPGLRVRLFEAQKVDMVKGGISAEFEVAFHTSGLSWPRTWVTIPAGHLDWILCGRFRHPLGKTTQESEVKKFPFVVPVYSSAQGLKHGEDQCPLSLKERILGDEVEKAEIGLQLVANTDQLIYVPKIAAKYYIDQQLVQEIKVRQWAPVREALYISVHTEKITQRLLDEMLAETKKMID